MVLVRSSALTARFLSTCCRRLCRSRYVQGQSPEPKVREYFYYIDHQGQLFMDDTKVKNFITCFKDKKFLAFFFKRLKFNTSERYADDFPFLSPCGAERNFVRCDDQPIVFTKILPPDSADEEEENGAVDGQPDRLVCNHAESFSVEFRPSQLCMLPASGRIYHPAPTKAGGIGLVKSSVAIEISRHFEFGRGGAGAGGVGGLEECAPPTHFNWRGRRWELTNEILDMVKDRDDHTGPVNS